MEDNTRKKLVDRGTGALADALISLASQDKLAADVVERLQKYRYKYAIFSLARQTYNPQLFERTTLKRQPQPGAAAILAIAEVYLASGEPGIANEQWKKKRGFFLRT